LNISNIATLSHEMIRVQRELHEYRHCTRHEQWETELKSINDRRRELMRQQKMIMKQSKECGVVFK
jgi:uncharacterized membrane protein (DUF106 family)